MSAPRAVFGVPTVACRIARLRPDLLWEQEVAGSSPAAPTRRGRYFGGRDGFERAVVRGDRLRAPRPARLALHALAWAGVVAGLSSAWPAPAAAANRTAVVGYYNSDRLPTLVDGLDAAGFPADAPVFFGNYSAQPRYGVASLDTSPPPAEVAGERYRYAPILQIHESTLWDRRRVTRSEGERLAAAGAEGLGGSMPSMSGVLRSSSRQRVAWGTELGRRFRDRFRERVASGEVDAWQLDEVLTEAAGEGGRAHREFARGVLFGLLNGRAALGDRPLRGLVHVSRGAFGLMEGRGTSESRFFWRRVNQSAARLIGEEYPFFRGRASDAARTMGSGQRALARAGGDRAALAGRYVVGMTPGYIVTRSLGGNVDGRPRDWVNRWRTDYIRARARSGVSGFGEYNYTGANDRASVFRDTTRALGVGVRRLR
jgi:hypothetical protein